MRSTDIGKQVDITGPVLVEIEVRDDGTVVYVHVDGFTVCRVCRVTSLIINDHRDKEQDCVGRDPEKVIHELMMGYSEQQSSD